MMSNTQDYYLPRSESERSRAERRSSIPTRRSSSSSSSSSCSSSSSSEDFLPWMRNDYRHKKKSFNNEKHGSLSNPALGMVEEECRRYRPTKNYLENTGPEPSTAFETNALQREMDRVQQRLPMEPLSMKRYELPPPSAGRLGEPAASSEAVDNSHAQLSHQATRVLNLELQLEYGTEAWRSYLNTLQALVLKSQNIHGQLRKHMASVNWERKRSQTASGARLRAQRRRWAHLVSDNSRLERAIMQLEGQVQKINGQVPTTVAGIPKVGLDSVKLLPEKLNSETEKEVQKKIEDMFAD